MNLIDSFSSAPVKRRTFIGMAAGVAFLTGSLPALSQGNFDRDWPAYASGCVNAMADVMGEEPSLQIVVMCSCQEEAAFLHGDRETYEILTEGRFREVSDEARFAINPLYTRICTSPDGEEDTPFRADTLERAESWWEENGA